MRVLFVIRGKEEQMVNGGTVCTGRNLNLLKEIFGGSNVVVYRTHTCSPNNILGYVSRFVERLIFVNLGYSAEDKEFILKNMNQYDFVYFDHSIIGTLIKEMRRLGYRGRVISFFHNIESRFNTVLARKWGVLSKFYTYPLYIAESRTVKFSDDIFVLNKRDSDLCCELYKIIPDLILPISFKDTFKSYAGIRTYEANLLFVGSNFFGNRQAVLWFDLNVLPFVEAKLIVVGSGMSSISKYLQNIDKIEVYDYVEDLSGYYQNASAVVLPIFHGGGMKIKTCESLMWGKFVIGTTEAFEGYDIYEGSGRICNTKNEFINEINNITKNGIETFNPISRRCYEDNYTNSVVEKKLKTHLNIR